MLLALPLAVHVLKDNQQLVCPVELDSTFQELLVYNAHLIVKLALLLDVQLVSMDIS